MADSAAGRRRLICRRRDEERWQALAGGLPEPLPAMPCALLATEERLFAGLAHGELWESRDRGETWICLRLGGVALHRLVALVQGTD